MMHGQSARRDWVPPPSNEPGVFLSAEEWLKRDFPEPERFLGQLIVGGVRMFIVGRTGLGKTLFGFALAVAMATGSPFLHWQAGKPIRVLYVDGEMPGALIRERLRDALRRPGNPDLGGHLTIFARDIEDEISARFPSLGAFQPLNTEAGHTWLLGLIDVIGGADAVMLDNVMSLLEGVQKEEEAWAGAIPLVAKLSQRGIAQIWLDHTGHNGEHQYGTSTKAWRFHSVAIMTPLPKDQCQRGETAFRLSFELPGKCRRRTPENWQDFDTCVIRLRDDRWTSETAARETTAIGRVSPSRVPYYDALVSAVGKSALPPGRSTLEAWHSECRHRSLIESPEPNEDYRQRDRRFRTFRTAKAELISARWIAVEDDTVIDLKGRWG